MGYTTFINNSEPSLSAEVLNAMQKGLLELVFPIGSTYITQTNNNPSNILGFGTWARFNGRVAIGLDEDDSEMSTIGKTGGEKTHKLTKAELPRITGSVQMHGNEHPNLIHKVNGDIQGYDGSSTQFKDISNISTSSGAPSIGKIGIDIGEDIAHNNMPPYTVTGYMWIREE